MLYHRLSAKTIGNSHIQNPDHKEKEKEVVSTTELNEHQHNTQFNQ